MSDSGKVLVTAAQLFDPENGRINITVEAGETIENLIRKALPGLSSADYDSLRVTLVTNDNMSVIDRHYWGGLKPKPGVRLVIRLVPGKDALRSVLSLVVTVAASALAGPFAGALGFASGSVGYAVSSSLFTLGVPAVGSIQVDAL